MVTSMGGACARSRKAVSMSALIRSECTPTGSAGLPLKDCDFPPPGFVDTRATLMREDVKMPRRKRRSFTPEE